MLKHTFHYWVSRVQCEKTRPFEMSWSAHIYLSEFSVQSLNLPYFHTPLLQRMHTKMAKFSKGTLEIRDRISANFDYSCSKLKPAAGARPGI